MDGWIKTIHKVSSIAQLKKIHPQKKKKRETYTTEE